MSSTFTILSRNYFQSVLLYQAKLSKKKKSEDRIQKFSDKQETIFTSQICTPTKQNFSKMLHLEWSFLQISFQANLLPKENIFL